MGEILLRQFKNPLLLIFIVSTVVAFILGQKSEAFVIWLVMTISILLGFWNEYQAESIVNDLIKKISFTTTVIRDGIKKIIFVKEVIVGDISVLYPGSIIPADMKLIKCEGLEIDESTLTGESLPITKKGGDIVYMRTVVTSGTAEGIVIATGNDTKFGEISKSILQSRPLTEFQKGLIDFSNLLAKIAGVTVLLIIVVNFFLGRPMVETILFALTVAMGITPELLPLIVTISLSYGAKKLAKESLIVKQFVSIEDLGNMEVLCTDKTGTLTEGKIVLSDPDLKTLQLGLICNSNHDSIDKAIWEYASKENIKINGNFKKIHETPFNFENRFMSVTVKVDAKEMVVIKGSPEVIIEKCSISENEKLKLNNEFIKMQKNGLRTIAVASGNNKNFEFGGFLSFSDIPKVGLAEIFKKFADLGVKIKILTGDSEIIAEKICREVNFIYKKILTGDEIEKMNEEMLESVAWKTDIFARVTPTQKSRIILALKKGGHTIGFLGDGVNDSPALHLADVGISVNTAVDIAKDSASVVLLHKSLGVIADGIHQGRITFNNTIKFILMGTSSDFGNMLSAAIASMFLPFLPMTPAQFLLNDILYDVSQLSIPTDNVDADQVLRPKNWDIGYIKRFMLFFGPISTVYDLLTFGIMYFAFRARGGVFQTGWFVESLITEILVVFVIRTRKIPFWKSIPSYSFILTCLGVVAIGLYLPFSPFAIYLGFKPLPIVFFGFLIGITITYLIFVEIGKGFLNNEIHLENI